MSLTQYDTASYTTEAARFQNTLRVLARFAPGLLHEIRNPMTLFRSVEYCLRPAEGAGGASSGAQQRGLDHSQAQLLVEQVQRVDGLLDAFVRLGSSPQGRALRSFDALLGNIDTLLRKSFGARGIELTVSSRGGAGAREPVWARDLICQSALLAIESVGRGGECSMDLASEDGVFVVAGTAAEPASGAAESALEPQELAILEAMAAASGVALEVVSRTGGASSSADPWQLLLSYSVDDGAEHP